MTRKKSLILMKTFQLRLKPRQVEAIQAEYRKGNHYSRNELVRELLTFALKKRGYDV